MPSLRALECFVAVLDHGSLAVAARHLHLSQPALSHHLASLERELGTTLFDRHPRGVTPTPAATAIDPDARAVVEGSRRLVRMGRSAAAGRTGRLRIGTAESMTAPLVAPLARRWFSDRPQVTLEVSEASSADALVAALEAGELDVAVCPRPTSWTGAIEVIGAEEVLVVCCHSHAFAGRATVAFEELHDQRFVHYAAENGLAGWIDALALRRGVALDPVTRVRHAASAAGLATAGLGVALVPRTALPEDPASIVIPLDPPLSRDVVALVRSGHDPLATAFARDLVARGLPRSGIDDDAPSSAREDGAS
ncbi:DNA-binding transcriptional LysR family regulator [Diaminobutyricimonas aerilata]|uniref:DNA-binding transcriptional LysR family regulator n=1 Tax=Diaminobutyricimonas aerilata TaxID=1162967 RepID=A0A2M9CNW7_9MICO|nr:LysR family transcriptional regulator [Diaminobutyricimonas aerilata]PJJ73593.1 DNA-binding transcriptional LysR family regulator [Diaminobutyricimonas aerilata]